MDKEKNVFKDVTMYRRTQLTKTWYDAKPKKAWPAPGCGAKECARRVRQMERAQGKNP